MKRLPALAFSNTNSVVASTAPPSNPEFKEETVRGHLPLKSYMWKDGAVLEVPDISPDEDFADFCGIEDGG